MNKLKKTILSILSCGMMLTTAIGCKSTPIYTVSFNSNGGTKTDEIRVEKGSKITSPNNVTKLGYDLTSWTCNEKIWDFENDRVYQDLTLYADWTATVYSIEYDYDGGIPNGELKTTYTIEESFELPTCSKYGFNFEGWYIGNKYIGVIINAGDFTGNLTLKAGFDEFWAWLLVSYENYSNFTVEGDRRCYLGQTCTFDIIPDSGYIIEELKIDGVDDYTITENEDDSLTFSFVEGTSNVRATVVTGLKEYSITYKNLFGADNSGNSNNVTYTIEDEIYFRSPYTNGNTFLGWTLADGTKIERINPGTYGDFVLYANWEKGPINVSITGANLDAYEYSGDGNYNYGDYVTLSIDNKHLDEYYFVGWYLGDTLLTEETSYSFYATANITFTLLILKHETYTVYNYNNKGQVEREYLYNVKTGVMERTKYTYDENGRVIRADFLDADQYDYSHIIYTYTESEGCLTMHEERHIYMYDEENARLPDLVDTVYYPNGDIHTYTLTRQSSLNQSTSYINDNTYDSESHILTHKYYSNGDKLEEDCVYTWSNDYQRCDYYESITKKNGYSLYNEDGQIIYDIYAFVEEFEDAESYYTSTYTYDDDEELVKYTFLDPVKNTFRTKKTYILENKKYGVDYTLDLSGNGAHISSGWNLF